MGFTRTVREILKYETRILTFQELTRIVQEHVCYPLVQLVVEGI
jgi:hypothetical protein